MVSASPAGMAWEGSGVGRGPNTTTSTPPPPPPCVLGGVWRWSPPPPAPCPRRLTRPSPSCRACAAPTPPRRGTRAQRRRRAVATGLPLWATQRRAAWRGALSCGPCQRPRPLGPRRWPGLAWPLLLARGRRCAGAAGARATPTPALLPLDASEVCNRCVREARCGVWHGSDPSIPRGSRSLLPHWHGEQHHERRHGGDGA